MADPYLEIINLFPCTFERVHLCCTTYYVPASGTIAPFNIIFIRLPFPLSLSFATHIDALRVEN